MPIIEETIQKGPLSAPERAILDVVSMHSPPFVWSTSLEDILELAKWAAIPASKSVPVTVEEYRANRAGNNLPDIPLKITTRVPVYMGKGKEPKTTYSLRTMMSALSRLHRTGRIWAYKMHNRTYYGSFHAEVQVKQALEKLSSEGQETANFTPL